ncbi:kinase-like domain-containing protein [Mycena epipterygia]|nr:kinase-like domain-containing protein [Mycena epipterygia]
MHQLYIDGDKQVYVAKKFFDAGTTGPLSKTENKVALANDLFRLKRLAMFREKYVDLARSKGFTEIADFEVSDGFLISIIETDDAEPTTYLVEPLRSSSVVRKFSGTLGATSDSDKLALTMLSFSHFIMECTACAMSIVDVQGMFYLELHLWSDVRVAGSFHADPGTVRVMTLFDPMSHTVSQESGVGDFGAPGIQDSIQTHRCNIFCHALGLVNCQVLQKTLDRQKSEHEVEA